MVWLVDPEDRTVAIHQLHQLPRIFEDNEEITGESVLPDLRCRVADLFLCREEKGLGLREKPNLSPGANP